MEQKKLEALVEKTKKSLAHIRVSDDNFKSGTKFIEKSHKIRRKLTKKVGSNAHFILGLLCLGLSSEKPQAENIYFTQACNFLEAAYEFNNKDPRAIEVLKEYCGLLEIPGIDNAPYYFYLTRPQLSSRRSIEAFEFQGKYYLEVHPLDHDHASNLCYVTYNESANGEVSYELVTDYAERDALNKAKWDI